MTSSIATRTLRVRSHKSRQCGRAPEPALSCVRASQFAPEAGPLDGVYQSTVSLADLRVAGADPSELLPENVGKMTFVFDLGRFATTTESPRACTWGYGTLTVRGGGLDLVLTGGGGIAPTGSINNPGELFTMQWSLYRDAFTLRRTGIGTPNPADRQGVASDQHDSVLAVFPQALPAAGDRAASLIHAPPVAVRR